MSLFSPNIIQDESDIELLKKHQAFMESLLKASNEVNELSKKAKSMYVIVGWQDLGEAFVGQYPSS